MSKRLYMYLEVNPEPWAVGPIQPVRRGGKMAAYMGKNQQLATFQDAVKEAVLDQWGPLPPLEGKIDLAVFLWRRRDEYTTPNQRKHRKHEADATNMLKAIEDALQSVLFVNDRDNISVHSHIMEQSPDAKSAIVVRLQVVNPDEHRANLMKEFPQDILNKIQEVPKFMGSDLTWNGPESF